jgi:serine/threonine protein kinase
VQILGCASQHPSRLAPAPPPAPPTQVFASLSEHVKPLILGLTATEPAERLGAAEAMTQEWLATGLALSAPEPDADDALLSPERQATAAAAAEWRSERDAAERQEGGESGDGSRSPSPPIGSTEE